MANSSSLEVRPGTRQKAGAHQDGGGKRLSAKAVPFSLHHRKDQSKGKASGLIRAADPPEHKEGSDERHRRTRLLHAVGRYFWPNQSRVS